jgi:hypothetical protein
MGSNNGERKEHEQTVRGQDELMTKLQLQLKVTYSIHSICTIVICFNSTFVWSCYYYVIVALK